MKLCRSAEDYLRLKWENGEVSLVEFKTSDLTGSEKWSVLRDLYMYALSFCWVDCLERAVSWGLG